MKKIAPGVCLTFDDLFVENWCAALSIFESHQARATFCVTQLHSATADQIEGLRALQLHGHEIGFHSRTHPRLLPYLRQCGLENWLAKEIDAGVEEHRAAGFPATSFASPFHASTWETRRETGKRFEVIRAKGPHGMTADQLVRRIYKSPGRNSSVNNIGSIDFRHSSQGGWEWMQTILDALVKHRGVGIFTGHDIRNEATREGRYSTHSDMERLLGEIRDRGLRFYTLTNFARISAG